jgi:AAA family ATP:ADP antiporter
VFFGSLLICFGKSCKYTVFDETKEITFIPLSDLEKRKSKAVVDGIVSRLGKSGGSLMLQFLIISCGGSIIDTFPYLSGICIIMLFVWIYAVMALGYQIEQHINVEPKPGDNTQAKVVTA